MATINIGSENASDVFYRCGRLCCGVEKRRTEREKDDKERVKCSPVFFFFLLCCSVVVVVPATAAEEREHRKKTSSQNNLTFSSAPPCCSFSLSLSISIFTLQVQDAAPPGQGEFFWC